MSAAPWACNTCGAVVFIPAGSNITGGVCTQQKRGCAGEIAALGEEEEAEVRALMLTRGIREQPWLTLVFATAPAGGAS